MLYQYEGVAPVLVIAMILIVPLTLLAVGGSYGAGLMVTLLWLVAFAACLWAVFHLGIHLTDGGEAWNPPAEGTVLSVLVAAVGLVGAFFAAPDKAPKV